METTKLNEHESLVIISQMIAKSKERLEVGSGNTFLLWGYITAIVSFAMWGLIYYTGNYLWCWGWFLIPVLGWPIMYIKQRHKVKSVVYYTDKIIDKVWLTLSIMFFFAILILVFLTPASSCMLPITLILCSVGTSFTGIVIQDKWLTFAPSISFIAGMLLLGVIATNNGVIDISWYLIFGACFVIMMIIPGHLLNRKAKKDNV